MKIVAALLGLVLSLNVSSAAQSFRATITGRVTDQTGASVPSAKVRAIQETTNFERATETSSKGDYTLPELQVGTYRVEIEAQGFKAWVRKNVVLNPSSTVRIDSELTLGEVTERLEVTAEAPLLQTDNSRVNTAVTPRLVQELPLVVSGQLRTAIDLALITPEAKDTGGALTISGGQQDGWGMMLDGINSSANQLGDIMREVANLTSPSIEALTEFSVDTNGFKAEYGRASGGVISYVSKSGTNKLHGNLYEFFRNDALDANNFFNNAAGRRKQVLKQHDFGFTVGGPVYLPKLYDGRNRTFFFFSYEGFRNRFAPPLVFVTIPLPEMYQGDFSNWKDSQGNLIPIYDPATTRSDGKGGFIRDPFPGNRIPVDRFSKVSQGIIKYATMRPNVADPAGILNPNPRNNFLLTNGSIFNGGSGQQPWTKVDIKVDHNLNANNRLAVLLHLSNYTALPPVEGTVASFPAPLYDFTSVRRDNNLYRFSWDRTISPRIFNQMRIGVNLGISDGGSLLIDGAGASLGIKNIPLPDNTFPGVVMQDYQSWGGRASQGGNRNKTYALADDLSFIKGSHSLKFGLLYEIDHLHGLGFGGAGTFTFSRLSTSLPLDQSGRTGNAFASMLLGQVASASNAGLRHVSDQWRYLAGYAQDDWRISSKLTLNYGVRYEYTPALVEGHFPDAMSNFDPTVPNPGAGGRLGASVFAGFGPGRLNQRTLFDSWHGGFGPRLGLAYSLDSKTVLRMSGSRSFSALKNTGGSAHPQGFIELNSFVPSDPTLLSPVFSLDNAYPVTPKPPFLKPELQNGSNIPYWPAYDSGRLPEFFNWNLNIQRQLPGNFFAEVGYNAVVGHHLPARLVDINQVDPRVFNRFVSELGAQNAISLFSKNINSPEAQAANIPIPYPGFGGSVAQALRPYPQYALIDTGGDGGDRSGNSSYHALVAKFEKRSASGLTLLSSYVLSKSLTDAEHASPSRGPGGRGSIDHYNRSLEKTVSPFDQTHNIKINYSYELPFGPNRKYLNSGALSHIVGGWRVGGIQTYFSGVPLNVFPGYSLPLFSTGTNRLTVLDYDGWRAEPKGEKFDPFADTWWNPAVFNRTVVDSVPSGNLKGVVLRDRFGSGTALNPKARGPWIMSENLSVSRTFQFTESVHMDFRWEMFNMLNRVVWGAPDSTLTSNTFGLVRSTANTPRQMQFALKVIF